MAEEATNELLSIQLAKEMAYVTILRSILLRESQCISRYGWFTGHMTTIVPVKVFHVLCFVLCEVVLI